MSPPGIYLRVCSLFILVFIGQRLSSQGLDGKIDVLPPSPTAASLGKYGSFPVSLHTGSPTISIPIYAVQGFSLQVPITLDYHASGIKVEEVPGWAGLGWSLNAGGVITRTIRGIADNRSGIGYLDAASTYTLPLSLSDPDDYDVIQSAAYGNIDFEPDLYSFNFLGFSGQFYLKPTLTGIEVKMMPDNDIMVLPPNDFFADPWIVIGEDGTRYTFRTQETTQAIAATDNYAGPQITSWFLDEIESVSGEKITFQYSSNIQQSEFRLAESDYILQSEGGCIPRIPSSSSSIVEISGVDLRSISSTQSTVYFETTSSDREDLFSGGKALNHIHIISNFVGDTIRTFTFNTSYFESSNNSSGGGYNATQLESCSKRLRLDELIEHSGSGSGKRHTFSYSDITLPSRCSNAQDHWGYFNGVTSNTTLLPEVAGLPGGFEKADRESNGQYMEACMLTKIEYPTGGFTVFNYEPHSLELSEDFIEEAASPVQLAAFDTPIDFSDQTGFSLDHSQEVSIIYTMEFDQSQLNGEPGTGAWIEIFNNNGLPVYQTFSEGVGVMDNIILLEGDYILKLSNTDFSGTDFSVTVNTNQLSTISASVQKVFGGLRIKSMEDHDGIDESNTIIRTYTYESPHVYQPFSDGNYLTQIAVTQGAQCGTAQIGFPCYYIMRHSSNQLVHAGNRGSVVGYNTVTESFGTNGENGSSEFLFSTYPNVGGGGFPYPPVETRPWRNGLLLSQKQLTNMGVTVKSITNSYEIVHQDEIIGMKAGFVFDHPCYMGFETPQDILIKVDFLNTSEWVQHKEVTEKLFDQVETTLFLDSRTELLYSNNHRQQIGTRIYTSDGEITSLLTTFPKDVTQNDMVINLMKERNMVNLPLEIVQWKGNQPDSRIIYAQKIGYKDFGSAGIQRSSLDVAEIPRKGIVTDPEPYYVNRFQYLEYGHNGNILNYEADGVPKSIIWAFDDSVPVAQAENARANEIAFAGFEDDSSQSWQMITPVYSPENKAGERSINLNASGSLTKSGLPPGKYILSAWYKNGTFSVNQSESILTQETAEDGWQYIEFLLDYSSGDLTVTGTALVDELRVHPEYSQMTTVNYSHLTGVHAISDPNGIISYFEYDDLGRLKFMKDLNRDILRSYQYKVVNE